MTIATVLALVDGGSGGESAIRSSLAVGRAFAAHVDLLHVKLSPEAAIPFAGDGMTGAAVERILKDAERAAEDRAKVAHELFERLCLYGQGESEGGPSLLGADDDVPAGRFTVTWRQVIGRPDQELARRGRLADLIVVARGASESGLNAAIEAALFDSGHPVMIAPPAVRDSLGRRVAIAWNGSREAARAASAALPFLGKAEQVVVLSLGDDAAPAALCDYLSIHGIAASSRVLEADRSDLGLRLLDAAQEARCDLLVMGAYGHSRLREFILGGVTDTILRSCELPVLMVH